MLLVDKNYKQLVKTVKSSRDRCGGQTTVKMNLENVHVRTCRLVIWKPHSSTGSEFTWGHITECEDSKKRKSSKNNS